MQCSDRRQTDCFGCGFGPGWEQRPKTEVISAFSLRCLRLSQGMRRLADHAIATCQLASFNDAKIFLTNMASVRIDLLQQIRIIVQDERYSSGSGQRQHCLRISHNFRFRMIFRAELQNVDTALKESGRHWRYVLRRHVAQIHDSVQETATQRIHSFSSSRLVAAIFSTKLVSKSPRMKS